MVFQCRSFCCCYLLYVTADDVVGSGSAGRETTCEVDEKTRLRRLQRLQVMEKERRKAVKAARRRLRQTKLQTQSENSVRTCLLLCLLHRELFCNFFLCFVTVGWIRYS